MMKMERVEPFRFPARPWTFVALSIVALFLSTLLDEIGFKGAAGFIVVVAWGIIFMLIGINANYSSKYRQRNSRK